jgi:hypothetical protein
MDEVVKEIERQDRNEAQARAMK